MRVLTLVTNPWHLNRHRVWRVKARAAQMGKGFVSLPARRSLVGSVHHPVLGRSHLLRRSI
jgi:hypothetical protein